MDTLTHALSGMLLARASQRQVIEKPGALSLRTRMAAGFLAAAFPDSDFVLWFVSDLSYLNNHRGLTHSFLMLPIWAWLLAMAFAWLWRGRYQWRAFYCISAMGIGIHILGDIITAYGTMFLAPFSMTKFSWPVTFILDPWFSGIILLTLLLAWWIKPRAQMIALAGLMVLVSYVLGYQGYMRQRALAIAEAYKTQQGWKDAQVHVLPQFLLPQHWKLMVTHAGQYHVSYVNVLKQADTVVPVDAGRGFIRGVLAYYQPRNHLSWLVHERYGKETESQDLARQIWSLDEFRDIRRFMLFPALDHIEQRAEGTCGIFIDHRFVIDGVRIPPFQFGACQDRQQRWSLYRFKAGELIRLK